jgi:hypothetical protein
MSEGMTVNSEEFIPIAGLFLFLSGTTFSRIRRIWLAVLSVVVLLFTLVGMSIAPTRHR